MLVDRAEMFGRWSESRGRLIEHARARLPQGTNALPKYLTSPVYVRKESRRLSGFVPTGPRRRVRSENADLPARHLAQSLAFTALWI